jgi:hypothetical protein
MAFFDGEEVVSVRPANPKNWDTYIVVLYIVEWRSLMAKRLFPSDLRIQKIRNWDTYIVVLYIVEWCSLMAKRLDSQV